MKKIFFLSAVSVLFSGFLFSECSFSTVETKKSKVSASSSRKSAKSNDKTEKNQFINAEYAILVDFDTNERLYSKKSDDTFFPASMTKLMTMYLLFSALADGRVKLDDEYSVSEKAQKMEGSRSFFKAGTMAKIEDLAKSIIIHSGNDACVIVAEGLSGDESVFVEEMNQKAEEFGLKNTHFNNSTGLPIEDHYSCASDLAILGKRIIVDFPQFYHYFSEKSFTINGITQPSTNTLLGNSLGVDGIKTGKTKASGYGIVASAYSGGKRLISVVHGCKSSKERSQDTNKLLAMGFREFISVKVADAGRPITTAKVWLGLKNQVNLCTHENISVSVPRKYKKLVTVEAKIKEPLDAPIAIGMKLGKLKYKFGNVESKEYDLFACEDVGKVGMMDRAIISIKSLIFGNYQ